MADVLFARSATMPQTDPELVGLHAQRAGRPPHQLETRATGVL
jgi:hypothetical protein